MLYGIIILLAYSCLTVVTSLKIGRSVLLERRQKAINIVLNALIPVLWLYLISPVIFPIDKLLTREEREKMISSQRGSKLGDDARSSGDSWHL